MSKKAFVSSITKYIRAVLALIQCTQIHCGEIELARRKARDAPNRDMRAKLLEQRNACNQKNCMKALILSLKTLVVLLKERQEDRKAFGVSSSGIDNILNDINVFMRKKPSQITQFDLNEMHTNLSISFEYY